MKLDQFIKENEMEEIASSVKHNLGSGSLELAFLTFLNFKNEKLKFKHLKDGERLESNLLLGNQMEKYMTVGEAERLFEKSGKLYDRFEVWCKYHALDFYLNSDEYEEDLQDFYNELKENGVDVLSQHEEYAMEDKR